MSSGSHETGSAAKKVTASDSVKPGPHIHIFFLIQGLRVRVEMGTKSEKVCMCVLGRSYILCFETVLGMNKITSNPIPIPKN